MFNGKPMKDVQIGLNAAYRRAGISDIGQPTHVLRHTFASHFVMRGGSIPVLQKLLGHKNISMTMRYAHLSPEHKRQSVNLLNGLTGGDQKSSMSQIVIFSDTAKQKIEAGAL